MDGHPTELAAPATSRRYNFAVNERPGTYWYHAHPHGDTARQAYLGLAGMLIVDDGNDVLRGVPTGIRDIPLVLADKRVTNGALVYQPTMMDIMHGWLGNIMTVNGSMGPVTTTVEPAVLRLRLLNASNARILNPAFADGRSFWLIATDGGLLDAPVSVSSVLLAPGERAEILLDLRGNAGQTLRFVSAAFRIGAEAMGGGMPVPAPPQGTAFDLLTLSVSNSSVSNPGSIPVQFAPIVRYLPVAATVSRRFELTGLTLGPGTGMPGMGCPAWAAPCISSTIFPTTPRASILSCDAAILSAGNLLIAPMNRTRCMFMARSSKCCRATASRPCVSRPT